MELRNSSVEKPLRNLPCESALLHINTLCILRTMYLCRCDLYRVHGVSVFPNKSILSRCGHGKSRGSIVVSVN